MSPREKRTYLFYRPRDFTLYLFSLLLVALGGWVTFSGPVPRALLGAGLAYMAVTFVLKHGVELDAGAPAAIVRGLLSYAGQLCLRLWRGRRRHIIRIATFLAVIGLELALRDRIGRDSFWMSRFPFVRVVLVYFSLLLLFRTAVFIGHLRRGERVRAVLEGSDWKRELKDVSTATHTIQAYVSGLITHACALMPALIFWTLTSPTYFREAALLVGSLLVAPWWAARARLRRNDQPFSVPALLLNTFVLVPADETERALHDDHQRSHQSRFDFAVLHGHHHDSIPSSLIGGPGQGFGEAFHEAMVSLAYLQGTFLCLTLQSAAIFFDMIAHQYIPGVPPYSRFVVSAHLHHVVHHYGSVKPLGLTGPPYRLDVENGYKADNRRARWFVEVVRHYEDLDDAVLARFTNLSGTGSGSKLLRPRA